MKLYYFGRIVRADNQCSTIFHGHIAGMNRQGSQKDIKDWKGR